MLKNFEHKLSEITELHMKIQTQLSDNTISSDARINLSKKFSSLEQVLECKKQIEKSEKQLLDTKNLLTNNSDKELLELAKQDIEFLEQELNVLYDNLKKLLIPKDIDDDKNAILEIRAGTGGDEASLFASDLLNMYQRYADLNSWKFDILSISETGLKGVKEAICNISGFNVFSKLKFESGVHRVQRVPTTESSGRVHTSAATVAVLPEAEEVDIEVLDKDLRIDVFRSSGPGGQSVNTTDSAVRITHIPTGIVVSQQDEKSQHKNKAKALKILRSRLLDNQIQEKNKERSEQRKNQVGSGDRSERIRTYNFPQGRVSDHRINLTLYNLSEILEGNIDELINPLIAEEESTKLANMKNE